MSLATTTEARLRRIARTVGASVRKSRARDPYHPDFGGYMICDIRGNYLIFGDDHGHAYSLSLPDVEQSLTPDAEGLIIGREPGGSWAI